MSAQVYSARSQTEGRRRACLEWKSRDLPYWLSFTCWGNVNYNKSVHHPIPTSGNRKYFGNFQNKSVRFIENKSFQLSVHVYSLLAETERKRNAFLRGCKKEGYILSWPRRAFGCHKRWKSLSFCEIRDNPIPALFFIRPPYK